MARRQAPAARPGAVEPGASGDDELGQPLGPDALRAAWRRTMARPMPRHLPHGLLLRILAYRQQANRRGDLSRQAIAELKRCLREAASSDGDGGGGAAATPSPRLLKPGTMLMREHDGVMHRVMVMAEGFAWRGTTYRSLSQVAFAITGTRWNGPRFFGLRPGKRSAPRVASS